jgi:hypothetical protein
MRFDPVAEPKKGTNPVADSDDEEVAVEASETSFEELAKRAETTDDSDEEETVLNLGRGDDTAEALIEKVVPMQSNEFTCRSCFLVKHRSQLADRKRLYCVDCA